MSKQMLILAFAVILPKPNFATFRAHCALYYICYKGTSMGLVIVLDSLEHSGCIYMYSELCR